MATLTRVPQNPVLVPNTDLEWEREAAFNGCVVFANGKYHMVYRALSSKKMQHGIEMEVSSIGYSISSDGVNFSEHKQIISPTEDWEIYGCEDPRITFMDGKFYIFYTALSVFPFSAYGIKLAVAVTTDFENFEKHPATTFNSKAMGLFPEKINGKFAALLTINTDMPPAKIALALFDKEDDMWSPAYWTQWYDDANSYLVPLLRNPQDQVELGAPPIKTEHGWLVIYSYIKNYHSDKKVFGIEAALLDINEPRTIVGRSTLPLLTPEATYELEGVVPNIIFPSGALIKNDLLHVYYGAADTRVALATMHLASLLDQIKPVESPVSKKGFTRYEGNPILTPHESHKWQKKGIFNPAAVYEDGRVHIVFRAQGDDGVSRMGYAVSHDGIHLDEILDEPIYGPREDFEKSTNPGGNSGCEDPRLTKIDDRFYMTYTAYDGTNPPRIALTSIASSDFLQRKWDWDTPRLISPPGVDDKDACIMKRVKGDGYVAFHRLGDAMWLDFLRDLDFPEKKYLTGGIIAQARKNNWDNVKVGISAPPLETEKGWLLIYHAVCQPGFIYKVGLMLLDYDDPRKVIARSSEPIFEPEMPYELSGVVPNVVFPCGAVVIDGTVFMYYGGADLVTGVATIPLNSLLESLSPK